MSFAVIKLLVTIIDLYWYLVIGMALMSWLIAFDVIEQLLTERIVAADLGQVGRKPLEENVEIPRRPEGATDTETPPSTTEVLEGRLG